MAPPTSDAPPLGRMPRLPGCPHVYDDVIRALHDVYIDIPNVYDDVMRLVLDVINDI